MAEFLALACLALAALALVRTCRSSLGRLFLGVRRRLSPAAVFVEVDPSGDRRLLTQRVRRRALLRRLGKGFSAE